MYNLYIRKLSIIYDAEHIIINNIKIVLFVWVIILLSNERQKAVYKHNVSFWSEVHETQTYSGSSKNYSCNLFIAYGKTFVIMFCSQI